MTSTGVDSGWWLMALPVSFWTCSPAQLLLLAGFLAFAGVFLAPGGLAWIFRRGELRGPAGFPLIGSLMTMSSSVPHRKLAAIARSFGAVDLMAFSMGFTRVIISSSPETAKELLNSSAFADRPVKESAYELLFHRAMGFAPYGDYWRNLRRIAASHLFSRRRIDSAAEFRESVGSDMIDRIFNMMNDEGSVKVKNILHQGSLNHVMETVFGRSYNFSSDVDADAEELKGMVAEGYDLLGMVNWGDHLPFLRSLDLQGVRKRCQKLVSRVNLFVGKIVDEHREKRQSAAAGAENCDDFVDILLNLPEENKLSDSDIIAVLWEMIFRGTDTVAILLEWSLARMVLHPDIQRRAQVEIDEVVGSERSVVDSDLGKLPYLTAIVKETLRMHPPGPLLSWARLAIHDVEVAGKLVPAGTTAMVNMWAITHDEGVWVDAEKFKPERFMGGCEVSDFSVMGSDLRLAPFGAGRRVCPGKALGLASANLWLAQLLQRFEWVVDDINGHHVDLTEMLRLSLEMKSPLVCKVVPRTNAFSCGGVI